MRRSAKARSRADSALFWLACAGLSFSQVRAVTPASWLTGIGSSWTDASRWSTNPFYPNNDNPLGTTYDATIAATGTTSYNVILKSDIALDSLTLDSASNIEEIARRHGYITSHPLPDFLCRTPQVPPIDLSLNCNAAAS